MVGAKEDDDEEEEELRREKVMSSMSFSDSSCALYCCRVWRGNRTFTVRAML